LEDVVTKEIGVGQKTGELFDMGKVSYPSIEDLKSLFSNKSNDNDYDVKDMESYILRTMECYARRCPNKKCKELHYWTEDNRRIWERK
jgi:hypothetical protein